MVNFLCNKCGRKYTYPRSLDRHVGRNHADQQVFSCNQCGKPLARSGNLEKHKGTCTTVNNMSINVYDFDDDKKVIYPLRVSPTLVPDRHVDLLFFERDGIQHYTTISNFSRLVGSQMSNHEHTVYCCKQFLHAYSSQ